MNLEKLFNSFGEDLQLITKHSSLPNKQNNNISILELLHQRIEEKNYDAALDIIQETNRVTNEIINRYNRYMYSMLDSWPVGLTHVGITHFSKKLFAIENNVLSFYDEEKHSNDIVEILTASDVFKKYGMDIISEVYDKGSIVIE